MLVMVHDRMMVLHSLCDPYCNDDEEVHDRDHQQVVDHMVVMLLGQHQQVMMVVVVSPLMISLQGLVVMVVTVDVAVMVRVVVLIQRL